jgi:transcriptional regulator with XRE-family HTH domain
MTLKAETGRELRKARKEKKLTIQELSDQSKVNFNYLGNIERGKVNATLDMLERIAQVLNKKITIKFD